MESLTASVPRWLCFYRLLSGFVFSSPAGNFKILKLPVLFLVAHSEVVVGNYFEDVFRCLQVYMIVLGLGSAGRNLILCY